METTVKNLNLENIFVKALSKCELLLDKYPLNKKFIEKEYSCIPCEVTKDLIQVYMTSKEVFFDLCNIYQKEANEAINNLHLYTIHLQRNTFERKCPCLGTVGDHSIYVVYMLLPATRQFIYYGSFNTPEAVCEAMEDFWKHEIDLKFILEDYYKNSPTN